MIKWACKGCVHKGNGQVKHVLLVGKIIQEPEVQIPHSQCREALSRLRRMRWEQSACGTLVGLSGLGKKAPGTAHTAFISADLQDSFFSTLFNICHGSLLAVRIRTNLLQDIKSDTRCIFLHSAGKNIAPRSQLGQRALCSSSPCNLALRICKCSILSWRVIREARTSCNANATAGSPEQIVEVPPQSCPRRAEVESHRG